MMISVSTALCSSAIPEFGDLHPAAALEVERLGDDPDGEDTHLAGGPGNHRGCAGARSAAHASRDEDHVSAGEVIANLLERFFGRRLADLWLRASAKSLCDL